MLNGLKELQIRNGARRGRFLVRRNDKNKLLINNNLIKKSIYIDE